MFVKVGRKPEQSRVRIVQKSVITKNFRKIKKKGGYPHITQAGLNRSRNFTIVVLEKKKSEN